MLGSLLITSCAQERSQANRKAVEVWEGHAEVVRAVLDGVRIRDDEFGKSADFFQRTIGVVMRMDCNSLGIFPTKEARPDFKETQQWFRRNRDRLYWDERAKVVRVKPPAGPGGPQWWHHESVVIELVNGRRKTTDRQVAETRKFFLDLTGIDVLAAGERRHFLRLPVHGVQRPLPQLREWYEANSDRLIVDKQTGKLRLAALP